MGNETLLQLSAQARVDAVLHCFVCPGQGQVSDHKLLWSAVYVD